MFLFQQITLNTATLQAIRNDAPEAVAESENFSTLDDMLNFMDDFKSFDNYDATAITSVDQPAVDQQYTSPFP